jgi:soluble lytic murein transglycosylase
MKIRSLLALGAALIATPVLADTVTLTEQRAPTNLPRLLSDADGAMYRQIAAALRAKDWTAASTALDALPNGALTPVFRAELYAARGAKADVSALTALLAAAPDLPQCATLARMASAQGATNLPILAAQHDLVRVAGASKRSMVRATKSDAIAARLAQQVQPLLKANDPATAEPLIEMAAAQLSPEAQSEWRARLAWAYFPDRRRCLRAPHGRHRQGRRRRLGGAGRVGLGSRRLAPGRLSGRTGLVRSRRDARR